MSVQPNIGITIGEKTYDFSNKDVEFKYRLGWIHDVFCWTFRNNQERQDRVRAIFGKLIEDLNLLELDYDMINDEEYCKRLVSAMLKCVSVLQEDRADNDLLFIAYNTLRNELLTSEQPPKES